MSDLSTDAGGASRSDDAASAAPRARALALHYARGEGSVPRMTARGEGETARRIIEVAREAGVPVREDADLVELFAAAEVGEQIPVELYEVVARLLTYLYRLNGGDRTAP